MGGVTLIIFVAAFGFCIIVLYIWVCVLFGLFAGVFPCMGLCVVFLCSFKSFFVLLLLWIYIGWVGVGCCGFWIPGVVVSVMFWCL